MVRSIHYDSGFSVWRGGNYSSRERVLHPPFPRLSGRRGCETVLGLFTYFFRHWWAQPYAEDRERPPLYLHGLKPVLSFTLSGKHMTYTYTHALILFYNKHITVTDIIFCMNSYRKHIHILVLITDLYLFRSHVGVIELILVHRYP